VFFSPSDILEFIRTSSLELDLQHNKNDKVFQEDFFELGHAALPNDIFIWHAARSNSYKPLDIFELSIYQGGSKEYLYIFESMLRIFTMLAHREQYICHII
jgi:hypothetical protein